MSRGRVRFVLLFMVLVYFAAIAYYMSPASDSSSPPKHLKSRMKFGPGDANRRRLVSPSHTWKEKREGPSIKELKTREEMSQPEKNKKILPVCVVEEHHEVIRYWFGAANLGLLSTRTGNTLVHIDGHSDLQLPSTTSEFPLFHYPSFWQLRYLMPKNDQFIVSAAVTGLLSHMIWVMPTWATKNRFMKKVGFREYLAFNVSLGINTEVQSDKATGTDIIDPDKQLMCYCLEALDQSDGGMDLWSEERCFRGDTLFPSIEALMSKEDCQPVQYKRLDILTEERMLKELLPGGSLQHLSKTEDLILDIDEDYFGCEASVMPLYAVGLQEDAIQPISRTVHKIFCGTTTDQELAADFFFQKLITLIIENRQLCTPLTYTGEINLNDSCLQLIKKNQNSLSFRRPGNGKPLTMDDVSCRKGEEELDQRGLTLHHLVKLLVAMTDEQLKTFAEIGLCLSMSPAVNFEGHTIRLRLCDGNNRPGHEAPAVIFHVPGEEEVNTRAQQLVEILQQMKVSPEIVTVCRSMRDGYTPRSRWRQIESSVLQVLQNVYGGPGTTVKLNYDPDLMGGPYGWPGRWDK